MFNLILLLCYIGCVTILALFVNLFKKNAKEAPKQTFIDVNDLPNWKPMSTLNKRSNKVLNQMYKGKGENLC